MERKNTLLHMRDIIMYLIHAFQFYSMIYNKATGFTAFFPESIFFNTSTILYFVKYFAYF